jgi:hypothetical protein
MISYALAFLGGTLFGGLIATAVMAMLAASKRADEEDAMDEVSGQE